MIEQGAVRVNRIKIEKTSHAIKAGDVLTLAIGTDVRVVRVLAEPERRGSAVVAQHVYELVNPTSAEQSV